jgi:hypothetical protein
MLIGSLILGKGYGMIQLILHGKLSVKIEFYQFNPFNLSWKACPSDSQCVGCAPKFKPNLNVHLKILIMS